MSRRSVPERVYMLLIALNIIFHFLRKGIAR